MSRRVASQSVVHQPGLGRSGLQREVPCLFSSRRTAAARSLQEVLALAVSSLEELEQIDPELGEFGATLFSQDALGYNMEVNTPERNAQVLDIIYDFCVAVSSYFRLEACHNCIEWLVRRFNILQRPDSSRRLIVIFMAHYLDRNYLLMCNKICRYITETTNSTDIIFLATQWATLYHRSEKLTLPLLLNEVSKRSFVLDTIRNELSIGRRNPSLSGFYSMLVSELCGRILAAPSNPQNLRLRNHLTSKVLPWSVDILPTIYSATRNYVRTQDPLVSCALCCYVSIALVLPPDASFASYAASAVRTFCDSLSSDDARNALDIVTMSAKKSVQAFKSTYALSVATREYCSTGNITYHKASVITNLINHFISDKHSDIEQRNNMQAVSVASGVQKETNTTHIMRQTLISAMNDKPHRYLPLLVQIAQLILNPTIWAFNQIESEKRLKRLLKNTISGIDMLLTCIQSIENENDVFSLILEYALISLDYLNPERTKKSGFAKVNEEENNDMFKELREKIEAVIILICTKTEFTENRIHSGILTLARFLEYYQLDSANTMVNLLENYSNTTESVEFTSNLSLLKQIQTKEGHISYIDLFGVSGMKKIPIGEDIVTALKHCKSANMILSSNIIVCILDEIKALTYSDRLRKNQELLSLLLHSIEALVDTLTQHNEKEDEQKKIIEIKNIGELLLNFNSLYYGNHNVAKKLLVLLGKLDSVVPESIIVNNNNNNNSEEMVNNINNIVVEDVGENVEKLETIRAPLVSLCATCASNIAMNNVNMPEVKERFFISKDALAFNLKKNNVGDALKYLVPCLRKIGSDDLKSDIREVFYTLSKLSRPEALDTPAAKFIANATSSVVRDTLILYPTPEEVLSPKVFITLLLVNTHNITDYHKIMLQPILDAIKTVSTSKITNLKMEDAIFIILSEIRNSQIPISDKLYDHIIKEVIKLLSDSKFNKMNAIDLLIRISGDCKPVEEMLKQTENENSQELAICTNAVAFLNDFIRMWDVLHLGQDANVIIQEALFQARSMLALRGREEMTESAIDYKTSLSKNELEREIANIKYMDDGTPLRRYRVMAAIESIYMICKTSVCEALKLMLELKNNEQMPNLTSLFTLTLKYILETQNNGKAVNGFNLKSIISSLSMQSLEQKPEYYTCALLAMQIAGKEQLQFTSLVSLITFTSACQDCATANITTKAGLRQFLSSVDINVANFTQNITQLQTLPLKSMKGTELKTLLFFYTVRECSTDKTIKYDNVVLALCHLAHEMKNTLPEAEQITLLKIILKIMSQTDISNNVCETAKNNIISIYNIKKYPGVTEYLLEFIRVLSSKIETINVLLDLIVSTIKEASSRKDLMDALVLTFGHSISNYFSKVKQFEMNTMNGLVHKIVQTLATIGFNNSKRFITALDIDNTAFIASVVMNLRKEKKLSQAPEILLGLYADSRILEVFTQMINTPQDDNERKNLFKFIQKYESQAVFKECFKFRGIEESRYIASIRDYSSALFTRIKKDDSNNNSIVLSAITIFTSILKTIDFWNAMDSIINIASTLALEQKNDALSILSNYMDNVLTKFPHTNEDVMKEDKDILCKLNSKLGKWISDIVSSDKQHPNKNNCKLIREIMKPLIAFLEGSSGNQDELKSELSLVNKSSLWCIKEETISLDISLTNNMLILYSIKTLELYEKHSYAGFNNDEIERLIEDLTKTMSSGLLKIFVQIPKIDEKTKKDSTLINNIHDILLNGVIFIKTLGEKAAHVFPLVATTVFQCLLMADYKSTNEIPTKADENTAGYDGKISDVYLFRLIHPFVSTDCDIRRLVLDVFVILSEKAVSTTLASVIDIISKAIDVIIKTKETNELWTVISLLSFFIIPFAARDKSHYNLLEALIPSLIKIRQAVGDTASWCEMCAGVLLSNMCMKSKPEYSSSQISNLIKLTVVNSNKRNPINNKKGGKYYNDDDDDDDDEDDDEEDEEENEEIIDKDNSEEDDLFVSKKGKKDTVQKSKSISSVFNGNYSDVKIYKNHPITKIAPSNEFPIYVSIVKIISIMAPLVLGPAKRKILTLISKVSNIIITGLPVDSKLTARNNYKTLSEDILRIIQPLLDEDQVPNSVFDIINTILSIEKFSEVNSFITLLGECTRAIVTQGTYIDQIVDILAAHLECKSEELIKFSLLVVINAVQVLDGEAVHIIKGIQGSLISLIDKLPPSSSSSIELNTSLSVDSSLEVMTEVLKSTILVHCGRSLEDIIADK